MSFTAIATAVVGMAPAVLKFLNEQGIISTGAEASTAWANIQQSGNPAQVGEAIRDLVPGFNWNSYSDETKVEIYSVYASLANAKDTTARDLARFIVYMEKEGWDHHKMSDTLRAAQKAIETGSVRGLFTRGAAVNWTNIDKYVSSRDLMSVSRQSKYHDHINKYMQSTLTGRLSTAALNNVWTILIVAALATGILYYFYKEKKGA